MFRVLFIGSAQRKLDEADDFRWERIEYGEGFEEAWQRRPDLVVFEAPSKAVAEEIIGSLKALDQEESLPFIAIIPTLTPSLEEILREAEDFLCEPYTPLELNVRVRRVLRRLYSVDAEGTIRVEDLVIDLRGMTVTLRGEPLLLTLKEYELLKLLASNPGRVFSRETLLNRIWGYDYIGGERTVDVHIRRLRAKVEKYGERLIETVRGVGYRFRPNPEPNSSSPKGRP